MDDKRSDRSGGMVPPSGVGDGVRPPNPAVRKPPLRIVDVVYSLELLRTVAVISPWAAVRLEIRQPFGKLAAAAL